MNHEEPTKEIYEYLNVQYDMLKNHANILQNTNNTKSLKLNILKLISNVADFNKQLINILGVIEIMEEKGEDLCSNSDTEDENSETELKSTPPNSLHNSYTEHEINSANSINIITTEENFQINQKIQELEANYIRDNEYDSDLYSTDDTDEAEDYIENSYSILFNIESYSETNNYSYTIPEENQKMIDIMNKELFEKLQQIRNVEGEVNDVTESSL
ncbi:MAG: hypothetical protein K0R02_374 [Rickettsiaceae bacterium]|jgi:hypothetical protein|nr:hypothetical protein [Rickettsiaceae bacterium]